MKTENQNQLNLGGNSMIDATIYEILQFAISMEEEGEKFYRKYADQFSGEPQKVFIKLANDEVEHARYFQSLYNELEESNRNDYLFTEEVVTFFNGFAKDVNYQRGDFVITQVTAAIKEGIKTEKNTIAFYEGLVKLSKDEITTNMLERMIAEEKAHAEVLEALL